MKVWIDQDLCTGDGLCEEIAPAVFTLLASLFVGGWVATQMTAGETHREAVIYGILTWASVTAVSLVMVGMGVRAGYFAVVSGTMVAQNTPAVQQQSWEQLARSAGVPQERIDAARQAINPEQVRAEATDPANRERAENAAVTAAWIGFVGALLSFALPAAAQVPTPDSHFGFRLGSDRRLASADAIEQYFTQVDAQSDRVMLIDLGPTTEGRKTIAAVISSPDNLRNLDRIRATNQRLSDPRLLERDEALRLAATQKAIVAVGASIHATEVGPAQSTSELLYWLATGSAPHNVGEHPEAFRHQGVEQGLVHRQQVAVEVALEP